MKYDAIVIGGGPAGVSTAIYLKRANINVAVIEKTYIGGQIGKSSELANYAGFVEKDTFVFCQNMKNQLAEFNIDVIRDRVVDLNLNAQNEKIIIGNKGTYSAVSIILCIGADAVKLDLDTSGINDNGISYCAVCDGNFYKDKVVCVVGGGNSALEDAIYLSNLAKEVHLVHRREDYKAESYLINELKKKISTTNKIFEHKNQEVTKVFGNNKLEEVELTNNVTSEQQRLKVDGLFLCIGRKPNLEFLKNKVETSNGYIKVDAKFETSASGVFAGGDCIDKQVRQVVTAVADGAMISKQVAKYIESVK